MCIYMGDYVIFMSNKISQGMNSYENIYLYNFASI